MKKLKEKLYISGNRKDTEKFEYYTNFFKEGFDVINPLNYFYKDDKKLLKKLLIELMDCNYILILDNNDEETDEVITEVNIAYNFDITPIFENEISEETRYAG